METKESLNHGERYVADVKNDEITIVDTFANAPIFRIADSPQHRESLVTLAAVINAYWKEIVSLRGKVGGK